MAIKNNEKIHRVVSAGPQPVMAPRRNTLALRKSKLVRRRIRQFFYVGGFTLSLAAITQVSYGFLMDTPLLKVKTASVEGVTGPLAMEIQGLVGDLMKEKQNILQIDTDELTEKLSRHPRIRDLSVQKIYPDKLVINAVERQEVAVLAAEDSFYLADNEGNAMERLDADQLARLSLPFISGLSKDLVNEGEPVKSESLMKAINLLQVLDDRNHTLYTKISDVAIQQDTASPIEMLTMHMTGGLDVRFGDGNPVEKLPRLEALLKNLEQSGVDPFHDLVYIDLRFGNMAAYMDRATASDVDSLQYDKVQRELDAAEEAYQATHGKSTKDSDDGNGSGAAKRTGSGTVKPGKYVPPARSQPQRPTNSANYPQYPQQNVPQQYYQQRQPNPAAQYPPLYNLPANQQRN